MKMKDLLQKPVAFHPVLARLFGGVNEALLWQQIHYWSDKGKLDDGWIYKTKDELEKETTLTRDQQDRARKNLEKGGWLTTELRKANGSPTLHYKVDIPLVENQLFQSWKTSETSITENTTESIAAAGKKEVVKLDSDGSPLEEEVKPPKLGNRPKKVMEVAEKIRGKKFSIPGKQMKYIKGMLEAGRTPSEIGKKWQQLRESDFGADFQTVANAFDREL